MGEGESAPKIGSICGLGGYVADVDISPFCDEIVKGALCFKETVQVTRLSERKLTEALL